MSLFSHDTDVPPAFLGKAAQKSSIYRAVPSAGLQSKYLASVILRGFSSVHVQCEHALPKTTPVFKKKKKSAATSRLTYRVVPAPCKVRPHKQTTSGLSLHRPLNLEVWERGEKRAGIVVTPNSYQLEQDSHQSLRQLLMVFYRSLK